MLVICGTREKEYAEVELLSSKIACTKKINKTEREQIFYSYWKLGDLSKQRILKAFSMTSIRSKYRYANSENHCKLKNAFYFDVY
ncbi:hypothetical protein ILUMI_13431, partial [Ignelater luminosus]